MTRPQFGELFDPVLAIPACDGVTKHPWQTFDKPPFTSASFAAQRSVERVSGRASKMVSGLVRQRECQAFNADLTMSAKASKEPHTSAATRNKCLRIQQPSFPIHVIMNFWKCELKFADKRVGSSARPVRWAKRPVPALRRQISRCPSHSSMTGYNVTHVEHSVESTSPLVPGSEPKKDASRTVRNDHDLPLGDRLPRLRFSELQIFKSLLEASSTVREAPPSPSI